MLVTGDKTVDSILTILFYAWGVWFGFYCAFRYPGKARKAIAEGKASATEKTVQWMIRGGIFMLVFFPIAFAVTVFLYFTGKW